MPKELTKQPFSEGPSPAELNEMLQEPAYAYRQMLQQGISARGDEGAQVITDRMKHIVAAEVKARLPLVAKARDREQATSGRAREYLQRATLAGLFTAPPYFFDEDVSILTRGQLIDNYQSMYGAVPDRTKTLLAHPPLANLRWSFLAYTHRLALLKEHYSNQLGDMDTAVFRNASVVGFPLRLEAHLERLRKGESL